MRKIPIFSVSLILSINIWSQQINVTDYGAKSNSFEDVTEQVAQAINACKKQSATTLVFPKGRYDFWPERSIKKDLYISNTSSETECPSKLKNIALLFEDIKDLSIEGNGSTFVIHDKMISWAFINCSNVSLNNIKVDYERPTMSELTFVDVQPNYTIAQIHSDSKYTIIDNKIVWYGEGWNLGDRRHAIIADTLTGVNRYSTFNPLETAVVQKENNYNLLRFEGDFRKHYKKGEILSIRNPIRDHVGAFVNRSRNVMLNNVTMHYMHGIGIISQFAENLEYKNVKVVPSNNRSIAAFADGMQFSGCRGHIVVDSCHFKGLHDDPINVHGTYLQIVEQVSSKEILVEFKHHQTYGFPAFYEGDSVSFVSQIALQNKGIAIVKSAQLISERQMKLTLDRVTPTSMKLGDGLENLTWTPTLEVRNSRFERTNARGLLVTTPKKVLIENNTFYRTGMYAILIAGDVNSWFESGAVRDITIRNNHFVDCAYNLANNNYQIAIEPENRANVKNHWVHQNITISNNTFDVFSPQILKAKSVNGLIFEGNKINKSNNSSLFKTFDAPAFNLDNCTKVKIKDNQTDFLKEHLTMNANNMRKEDVKTNLTLNPNKSN